MDKKMKLLVILIIIVVAVLVVLLIGWKQDWFGTKGTATVTETESGGIVIEDEAVVHVDIPEDE